MRNKIWVLVLLMTVILAMTVSGCSLMNNAQKAVEAAKEAVAEQTAPTKEATNASAVAKQDVAADEEEVSEPEGEPEEIDVVEVESLTSYRQLISWEASEGDETQSWSLLNEFVREPAAQRSLMHTIDESGAESGWETIQIGTTTFMRYSTADDEGEWMSMTSDEAEPPTQGLGMYDLQSPEHYLNSGHCSNKGRDDVEGQRATHYVCTREVFDEDLLYWISATKLNDAGMEFWISSEYNVEVRNITWWDYVNDEDVDCTWRMEQKVWDINKPITIEAPEGVAVAGLPEDVPLYPDAKITTAMTGMVAFEVVAELDDVVAFFKEEMPNNGWTLESEYAGMLGYVKDGRQVSIMMSQDDAKVSGAYMLSE